MNNNHTYRSQDNYIFQDNDKSQNYTLQDNGVSQNNDRIQDNDGVALASRFSYITNALNYCGPSDGHKDFYNYLTKKSPELKKKIGDAIKKFEALYPYLKFIAQKTGRNYLDHSVVEAYWLGNELLEKFDEKDMKEIVAYLIEKGLPKSMAEKLIENMPSGAIPFHMFHVMYVGVGNVTGHVKTTLQNMDNCRISCGKVIQVIDDKLIVHTDALAKTDDKYYLEDNETKTIVFSPAMLEGLKLGDYVAIHWGFACKILTLKEKENLVKYTNKTLSIINGVADR